MIEYLEKSPDQIAAELIPGFDCGGRIRIYKLMVMYDEAFNAK